MATTAASAGIELPPATSSLLIDAADAHAARLSMQAELFADLARRSERPVLQLPQLTGATFDATDLEVLADVVALQVGEDGPRADQVPGWVEGGRR